MKEQKKQTSQRVDGELKHALPSTRAEGKAFVPVIVNRNPNFPGWKETGKEILRHPSHSDPHKIAFSSDKTIGAEMIIYPVVIIKGSKGNALFMADKKAYEKQIQEALGKTGEGEVHVFTTNLPEFNSDTTDRVVKSLQQHSGVRRVVVHELQKPQYLYFTPEGRIYRHPKASINESPKHERFDEILDTIVLVLSPDDWRSSPYAPPLKETTISLIQEGPKEYIISYSGKFTISSDKILPEDLRNLMHQKFLPERNISPRVLQFFSTGNVVYRMHLPVDSEEKAKKALEATKDLQEEVKKSASTTLLEYDPNHKIIVIDVIHPKEDESVIPKVHELATKMWEEVKS